MIKSLRLFVVFCLLHTTHTAHAAGYGSGWYGELQASIGYEDNIARTYLSDEQDDRINQLSLGGGYAKSIGRHSQIVVSGYFLSQRYAETNNLNSLGLSLGLDYTFQPNPSYAAPWYQLSFNVTDRNYKNSRSREALEISAELSAHKRFSTELVGYGGYRFSEVAFNGKSSAEERNDAAFETQHHEIFVGVDYWLADGVYVFGEYGYREGDVLSTVSGGLRMDLEYGASTLDPAYNSDCGSGCSFAYRQDGETHLYNLGFTFPIGQLSLDVGASYFDATGDNGRSYEDTLFKVGLLWIF